MSPGDQRLVCLLLLLVARDSAVKMSVSKSFLDATPRMSDLYRLVIRKVAHKWEELCIGLKLDEDGSRVEIIRKDFIQQGVENCCLKVIRLWLGWEGAREMPTWQALILCLQDMAFNKVAKEIKEDAKLLEEYTKLGVTSSAPSK